MTDITHPTVGGMPADIASSADVPEVPADVTLRPSGEMPSVAPDSTIRPADGTIAMADGTIRPADGTIRPADGTIRPADGTIAMADGTIAMADGTIAMADGTIRPAGGTNIMPSAQTMPDRTIRTEGQSAQIAMPGSAVTTFLLKGEEYEQISCLSDNSGEAQVFLVRKDNQDYVLKIYYPNFDINKKLMQTIRCMRFEMIVHLYDYGKTYVEGKHRYYELMEYLQGGTLKDLHLDRDYKRFRRLALQGAAALAYCHQQGVLHKDIKPTNFFFRDREQTQLVLGDFGISALQENESKSFRTTQARTPIYAAPEMYTDVIDGVVEITSAADYYSLGMTLFALWLGENPMSSNERVMMKQKNEGRLPRLQELPDNVRTLVQGLTAVNLQNRWTYDEVERWFKGEKVEVDTSSPFLRYKSFIVDPEKNIVADNVHELVPLLLEHDQLAMNYLYGGRIIQWLENCGNQRLATVVKDIVTNRYPADQRAGLMASVYAMEPTQPYRDLRGTACDDVHEVALSLLTYQDRYALALRNPNDALFLWVESHTKCDLARLRSYFGEGVDGRVAVLKLVYEIDPDMPFVPRHASSTLHDIVNYFGSASPTEDDWNSLCDGRLLAWMHSHEEPMACETLRILTHGQPCTQALGYKVLYNMDRTAAYDLREASTPEAIGEYLANRLMQNEHVDDGELARQMEDFTDPTGRFYYFAQLHGWYDYINEANRCFDLRSEENRDRLSAYDLRTALYRFSRILGATPKYLLRNGAVLTDGRRADEASIAGVRQELTDGSLAQWMSVFYHEDPSRDFAEAYSYERELESWVVALGRLDPQQVYYRRFMKAREQTQEGVAYVRDLWKSAQLRERIWQVSFWVAFAVWVLLVLVLGIPQRKAMLDNAFLAMALPLGGMTAVIAGVRAWFKGFGPSLSFGFGVLGFVTSLIPIYVLKTVDSWSPTLFNYVVVAFSAVYAAVARFTDFSSDTRAGKELIVSLVNGGEEDVKSTLLEPLYYTFKTKSRRYKGSKSGLIDEASDQVRALSGESVLHYVLWALLFVVLIIEFCIFI